MLMSPGADFVAPKGAGMTERFAGMRSMLSSKPDPASLARMSEVAVATVTETSHTGLTINDVPQYDIFLTVTPRDGTSFVSKIRSLLSAHDQAALAPGTPVPVRFDPGDHDRIALADMNDPQVQDAVLQWRIDRGLIHPDLVGARRNGIAVPASVLAVRPTGRRAEGQVELQVRLLVTPEDGSPSREVETWAFVYPAALSHVQVGSPVIAMYETARPERVAMTIDDPSKARS
jgi:protein-tyrosine-phosphatase